IAAVVAKVERCFGWSEPVEVTLEANPEDLGLKYLEAALEAGVNRLSLGVQSLDGSTLRALGRLHGTPEVHAAARAARGAGFRNLNFDLICGLPGQAPAEWARDVEVLIEEHDPEHVSVYMLDMDKQTPLALDAKAGRARLPCEDEVVEAFTHTARVLQRAGYERYEVSNFARPGFRARHNLKYWSDAPFLGVGPSAWSYLGARRLRRVADLERYLSAIEDSSIPYETIEPADPDRRLAEALIMGLRLCEGVDLAACGRRYDRDVWAIYGERIRRLQSDGWLESVGERLRLSAAALPVANSIWAEFL
ncbi:MAG: coproporphyrinogen-III oxidase family protein, partial [Acidobacteriota bacterium]